MNERLWGILVDSFPKLLGYGVGKQLVDILPSLLMSAVMFACVYPLAFLPLNHIIVLIIQIAVGVAVYVLLSIITKNESLRYLFSLIRGFVKRK